MLSISRAMVTVKIHEEESILRGFSKNLISNVSGG